MSARKLYSHVARSSNSSFILRRHNVTNLAVFSHHLANRVSHSQTVNYSQALGSLTKDQAHDLVFRLNDEERMLLMRTLEQFNVTREKDGLESAATPHPKTNDLMKLALINSLPFVGFGFLDNFTMIIAGDYIEHSLGLIMTISTMAAAALGNTISDVLGIGSAVYVERFVEIIGIRPPDLTPTQLEMKASRRASNMGRVLGITIGCLLGMIPLIFMKDKKEKEGEKASVDTSKSAEAAPATN